jgi:hypothetical protein
MVFLSISDLSGPLLRISGGFCLSSFRQVASLVSCLRGKRRSVRFARCVSELPRKQEVKRCVPLFVTAVTSNIAEQAIIKAQQGGALTPPEDTGRYELDEARKGSGPRAPKVVLCDRRKR